MYPRGDCPHLAAFTPFPRSLLRALPAKLRASCLACGDHTENWMNLAGPEYRVLCSRYVRGHGAAHAERHPEDCIAVSFSDLSVHCYACDDYIKHPSLLPLLKTLEAAKFSGENPSDGTPESAPADAWSDDDDEAELSGEAAASVLATADLAGLAAAVKDGSLRRILVTVCEGAEKALHVRQADMPEGLTAARCTADPAAFWAAAADAFPSLSTAAAADQTDVQRLLSVLAERGLLHRVITENVDGSEREAHGVAPDAVVEAYGSVKRIRCTADDCRATATAESIVATLATAPPMCSACGAPARPDVSLSGEGMSSSVAEALAEDFPGAVTTAADSAAAMRPGYVQQPFDCVICIGGSLSSAATAPLRALMTPGTVTAVLGTESLDWEPSVTVAEAAPTAAARLADLLAAE